MSEAAENKGTRVYFLYLGLVQSDDELFHSYCRLKPNVEKPERDSFSMVEWTREEEALFKKRLCHVAPGAIFAITEPPGKENKTVTLGTDEFLGHWPDTDDRVKWIAKSRAVENAFREAKRLKEIMSENAAVERLTPFRLAYKSCNAEVKRQMLAEIIRFITT